MSRVERSGAAQGVGTTPVANVSNILLDRLKKVVVGPGGSADLGIDAPVNASDAPFTIRVTGLPDAGRVVTAEGIELALNQILSTAQLQGRATRAEPAPILAAGRWNTR